MKETIVFEKNKNKKARGIITLELTDAETGETLNKQVVENMVFEDMLFSWRGTSGAKSFMDTAMSTLMNSVLALCDNDTPLNADFPFLRGNVVGYGIPSTGSSGLLQGAANMAVQKIAGRSGDIVSWRFQFEFLPSQANGTIKNIGLTHQWMTDVQAMVGLGEAIPSSLVLTSPANRITDGFYEYRLASGIVSIIDLRTGITSTVDLTSILGSAGTTMYIGFDPITGRGYVAKYDDKKIWEYSDKTFTQLLNTYTGLTSIAGAMGPSFIVYGDFAYFLSTTNRTLTKINYKTNAVVSQVLPTLSLPIGSMSTNIYPGSCTVYADEFGVMLGHQNNSTYKRGGIFDFVNNLELTSLQTYYAPNNGAVSPFQRSTISKNRMICATSSALKYLSANACIAAKVLDTPLVKTSANGLVVTYELEVNLA